MEVHVSVKIVDDSELNTTSESNLGEAVKWKGEGGVIHTIKAR